MPIEAEMGVMLPLAKDAHRHKKLGKAMNGFFPRSSKGSVALVSS
jgi:hypothetical protein